MRCSNLLYIILAGMTLMSAPAAVAHDAEVNRLSPRMAFNEYRPNEVIVKFKISSSINLVKKSNGKIMIRTHAASALGDALSKLGVAELDPLMPLSGAESFSKIRKAYNGATVKVEPMDRTFIVKLNSTNTVEDAVAFVCLKEDGYRYEKTSELTESLRFVCFCPTFV